MKTTKVFRSGALTFTGHYGARLIGLGVFVLLGFAMDCLAQGTMQLRFDGQPAGTRIAIWNYSESGVEFWNPYGPENLARVGSGVTTMPDNGTAYLQVSQGATLRFQAPSLPPFNLVSLDLAEYTTTSGPARVHLVAYSFMAAVVGTIDFTTDGINDSTGPLVDFETFTFDTRFQNVLWVEMTGGLFSLDNLVISGVPEPSSGGLILVGVFSWLGWSRVRRMRL